MSGTEGLGEKREVEVKFPVADLKAIRRRLAESGAERIGKGHEENLVFDDEAGRLRGKGNLLRLRRDRRNILTFKSPLPDPRFKVRREVQVEVGDFEVMRSLLEALGFRVVRAYEKERETWRMGGVEVLLDELYFGHFVELEGEREDIERVAGQLGLDMARAITRDYLSLEDEFLSRIARRPGDTGV